MPGLLRVIVLFSLLATCTFPAYCQSSVLSEGSWYKLSVKSNGLYKIDYAFLKNIGLNPDNLNPKMIKIFGNGAGMLPQANNLARPADLLENKIFVNGENDGKFNPGDYILFYAQSADSYFYSSDGTLNYEHHLYDDTNYYYLTVGTDNGLRIETVPNLGADFPKINSFNAFQYYEKETNNLLKSGREWYSEKFNATTSHTFNFPFQNLIANSQVKITSAVMAQSFAPSKFILTLNGIALGEQIVASIDDFNKPSYLYSIKGREDVSEFVVNSDGISGAGLQVGMTYEKTNSRHALGFLNYLLVETLCQLNLNDAYTIFRSIESLNHASSTFQISGATSKTMVWDVTSPLNPAQQEFTLSGSTALFGTGTSTLKEFIAFDPDRLIPPAFETKLNNQNIHAVNTPELLIVTHADFLSEARRLADFRSSHDNLDAVVVTTDQIYNEFSSGKQDVVAIRDFVKHLYDKSNRLRYLLLVGRSSYDYKDVLSENTNFVPIYESVNSLNPLRTYASDDFYGFLGDDEGSWPEVAGGNHILDIGIGRLPVSTPEMARDVVNKIIQYSTNSRSLGSWRNEVTFVADDGDNNIHVRQADQLATLLDTTISNFNSNKLYLDAYPQTSTPSGQRSPKTREALKQAVENGTLIVNFTGHGGEQVWMQEEVLNVAAVEEWSNPHRLPLFVTATCEFSRHDDPERISGGEAVITKPAGGGIAIISTCRPVFSSSNFELNKAFYKEVFRIENGEYLRLGDIIKATKNNSIDEARDATRVGNRNFALLGDPSLRLNYPAEKVALTAINDNSAKSDTLKALGKIKFEGEVRKGDNSRDAAFNGEAEITIYDKPSESTTLGNESAPYTYSWNKNVLFRGTASIQQGTFEFEFVVPKNISYQPGSGKISLYAIDKTRALDANGADNDLVIGGTASNIAADQSGPGIEIFFGDSTFNGKGLVDTNTLLLAKITDENGINISGYGVANNITATLDGGQTIILNDYFTASKNTYQEGWVIFPLNDLSRGKHKLTLKAWDSYNNPGERSIEFVVAEPGNLLISNLTNYPNPFYQHTTLAFEHNRSGDDLEVNLQIISRQGQIIKDADFFISNSNAHVKLWEWDGTNDFGQKLEGGIYLYKVTVRSTADGAKNQRYEKLILIN